ncbi:MAG: hypothetical protein ACRDF5_11900 [bacterium]
MGASADIIEEARRLTDAAQRAGTRLKLTGGLGVYFHSPSAAQAPLRREYRDLDFVGRSADRPAIQRLLQHLGYAPDVPFNTLQGHRRLRFWDANRGREVDVFLDQIRMCHIIDLRARLEGAEVCLAPADLLLTKMQIVEINRKDLLDILALLADHPTAHGDVEAINVRYIAGLAAQNWGLCRTLQLNTPRILDALAQLAMPREPVRPRLDELWQAIEAHPKRVAWRLRARIGDRVRWYDLPEEGGPA